MTTLSRINGGASDTGPAGLPTHVALYGVDEPTRLHAVHPIMAYTVRGNPRLPSSAVCGAAVHAVPAESRIAAFDGVRGLREQWPELCHACTWQLAIAHDELPRTLAALTVDGPGRALLDAHGMNPDLVVDLCAAAIRAARHACRAAGTTLMEHPTLAAELAYLTAHAPVVLGDDIDPAQALVCPTCSLAHEDAAGDITYLVPVPAPCGPLGVATALLLNRQDAAPPETPPAVQPVAPATAALDPQTSP